MHEKEALELLSWALNVNSNFERTRGGHASRWQSEVVYYNPLKCNHYLTSREGAEPFNEPFPHIESRWLSIDSATTGKVVVADLTQKVQLQIVHPVVL